MIATAVPGEFEMKGMFPEVFFILQYALNFTFVVTKPPDGQWGAIQSDGTWSGMVRELQEDRADIGNISTKYSSSIFLKNISFSCCFTHHHKRQKQCHYICTTNCSILSCFVYQKSSGHIQLQSLLWTIKVHVMVFCWDILRPCTNFTIHHCTIWIWTFEMWIYMGKISGVCSLCINNERLEFLTQSIFIQVCIHGVSTLYAYIGMNHIKEKYLMLSLK